MSALEVAINACFALGLAQGLFLWLQLWRLRYRNFFGYGHLLLALTAIIAVLAEQWMVYGSAWREFPHAIRATEWVPFLFGPGLWLFVVSLERPLPRWRDALHYVPALVSLLYFLPFLLQSGSEKLEFALRTHSIPLDSSVFGMAKAASIFSYAIAIRVRLRRRPMRTSDRLTRRFATATTAFLVFTVVLFGEFVIEHVVGDLRLPSDVLGAVGLGLFIYAASLIAVADWRDFALSLAPRSDLLQRRDEPVRTTLLDEGSTSALYLHVLDAVTTDFLYREPGLKIDRLARTLDLPAHYLSFAINAGSGRNFQSWLNQLRIAEAKRVLSGPAGASVLVVGLACGFNSKASFNRAFKAETGQTPSEFRANAASQIAN